jgi:hypothetical protein
MQLYLRNTAVVTAASAVLAAGVITISPVTSDIATPQITTADVTLAARAGHDVARPDPCGWSAAPKSEGGCTGDRLPGLLYLPILKSGYAGGAIVEALGQFLTSLNNGVLRVNIEVTISNLIQSLIQSLENNWSVEHPYLPSLTTQRPTTRANFESLGKPRNYLPNVSPGLLNVSILKSGYHLLGDKIGQTLKNLHLHTPRTPLDQRRRTTQRAANMSSNSASTEVRKTRGVAHRAERAAVEG